MKQHTGIGDWIATSYESGTPFLQQVPRDCADFLLLNAQIREYDAGEIIINGDSEGMAFCVLQSGRAQICGQILPDGHYSVLAYIESGGCFGEMSIICNAHSAKVKLVQLTATALTLSKLLSATTSLIRSTLSAGRL